MFDEFVGCEVDVCYEVFGVVVGEDDLVVVVVVGVVVEFGVGFFVFGGEDVFDGVDGVGEVGVVDGGEI